MKIALTTITLLFLTKAFGQDHQNNQDTRSFFSTNKIVLNYIPAPAGFTLYYNCDSMLFMRGDFGDTIKIWTPGMEWMNTLGQFKELMGKPDYGVTMFPKSFYPDGSILVASYVETQFIYRNDSLFQLEDTVELPTEYYDLLVKQFTGLVDSASRRKTDSISTLYSGRHSYVAKLIYAKSLFKSGKKKIKLPKKVNFLRDEIVLEKEWVENSKRCFLLRINNKVDGEETTYAYALNEDMKFIWWQGCLHAAK